MRPQTQRLGLRLGIVAGANSSAMSIDVALSTRRGVGRDTYSLPKKNAATPQVARQWTCHHYIKDTYSLPQKRGCAASGTSMGEAA